jgi:3-oxoacyl-[acyl-carrier-protein] synthase-3
VLLDRAVGRVTGTGAYLPDRIVTNDELEARCGTTSAWVVEKLGIHERRVAAEGQLTSDLAAAAADAALRSAGVAASDVDLLIVATSTPDRVSPSTACLVHDKIGMSRGAAFDLNAVCSGFLYSFGLAQQLVAAGVHQRVLVVGADRFSSITDWNRRDSVFFGDGAGAVLVEATDGPGLFVSEIHADGSGRDAFTVHPGQTTFSMDGRAVYKTGTTVLPEVIGSVLERAGLGIDDIALMVPHQPSIRVLRRTAELIGLPFERVMTNMDRYANTSGGTVPIALHEAIQAGRLQPGDHLLFAVVGSGWTWGAAVLRWV